MSVLILDNYDSFTFNLYQLISSIISPSSLCLVKRNDEINIGEIKKMAPSHIVLSPGPGHPANERDFGVCKNVILEAQELDCPILGVCLGHQGIVEHSGGKVIRAREPVHGKCSPIEIKKQSPLFEGLSSGAKVMRYHSLIADASTLPESLEVVAVLSGQDQVIMAVQSKKLKLFGLQFHPESIGSTDGTRILRNFISLC